MADSQKRRLVYWLTEQVNEVHRDRALILNKRGFAVQFFQSLEGLTKALTEQRVAIIVVGDEGPSHVVEKNISQLMSIPDVQGVRLLLSVSSYNEQISMLAACNSFRDLLPLDLDEKQWISRFIFATARSPIPIQEPHPQLTFNHLAAVSLPARLVWVSSRRILFEARLRPEPGSSLHLSGAFVKALGLQKVTLVVEESRRTDLIYRFSDAAVARWNVPISAREGAEKLLAKMRQTDFGPRCKVFLAIQDKNLRGKLTRELDPLRFEVNSALQKQSIVDEPRFFCPHIVFIEDRLCSPADYDRFRQMLDNLSAEVPVYVIGNRVHIRKLQNLDPLRKITQLSRLPERLTDAIFTKFLPPNSRKSLHSDEDAVNIMPDHPFSLAEITVSARLLQVHPNSAKIAVPVQVESYGLCKVDSPVISKFTGSRPYAKILESYANPKIDAGNFGHIIETYLSDLPLEMRLKLGTGLSNLCLNQLSEQKGASSLAFDEAFLAVANAKNYSPTILAKMEAGYEPPRDTDVKKEPSFENKSLDVTSSALMQEIAVAIEDFWKPFRQALSSKGLRHFVLFVSVVTFLITSIYFTVTTLAPKWHKSGGHFTESLRHFAPQKFEVREREIENQKR